MAQDSIDHTTLGLIKTLHEQAYKTIPIDTNESPLVSIRRAFDGGDTIAALVETHPRYDAEKGRIFPFYEEDEGIENVGESDDYISPLIEDIAYDWVNVNNATELVRLSDAYALLCSNINDLATWHPRYDADHGFIEG